MFYTYIWKDAAGVPFYVGKGTGKRCADTSRRSAEFLEEHKAGGCTVEIVDEFILESQAHAHEIDLIDLYGRREFGGLLVNKTDGGEGSSGFQHSMETRALMSETRRGRKLSQGQVEMLSEHMRGNTLRSGKPHSPAARAKIGDGNRGFTHSADARSKMSTANRMRAPRSGLKGVFSRPGKPGWFASIFTDGKNRYLGAFRSAEEAASAYDAAAIAAWGASGCYLNFPFEVSISGTDS